MNLRQQVSNSMLDKKENVGLVGCMSSEIWTLPPLLKISREEF